LDFNEIKIINSAGNDANLRKHIGLKHKRLEYMYESQKRNITVSAKNVEKHNFNRKMLDQAAIYAIVLDSRTFGDFRKPGMQYFLSRAVPGYKGPCRKTVRKYLKIMYRKYRTQLNEQLKAAKYVSITTDVWKNSSSVYFICITVHYLNENYEYISKVLSFRKLKGRELASNLAAYILCELTKFNLVNKIAGITTDSGSSIKAACKNIGFGIRLSCMGHDLNLVVANGLKLWKKVADNQNDNVGQENDLELDLTDVEDLEEENDEADADVEAEAEAAAEVEIEFVDSDEYKSDLDHEDETAANLHDEPGLYELNQVLKKLRKLIKKIRKSSILINYVRTLVKQLDISALAEMVNDFHVRYVVIRFEYKSDAFFYVKSCRITKNNVKKRWPQLVQNYTT
jgi:hypothetical protein